MNFNSRSKYEKLKPIIAIVSCIIVFAGLYLGAFYYNLNKIEAVNKNIEEAKAKETGLTDDILVNFTRKNAQGNDEVYYKITIGELKKTLKVEKIEEEELVKILGSKGYERDGSGENNFSFSKGEGVGLKPNKYYIGDKDGYIAIYKTDEKGKAFIEKPEDVSFLRTSDYPEPDIERIKSFAREFNNRAECEEALDSYKG
ncbi:MAG: hypothetical protein ACRCWM_05175 [Sarcina sp.]